MYKPDLDHLPVLAPLDAALAHPYPYGGLARLSDGSLVDVYLGHPEAACDVCHNRLGDLRRHPRHPLSDDVYEVCGGVLMKFVL